LKIIRRLFRSRKYKSGTGWCLWRWTDVDTEYITRLHVLKTPWFAICLHWINKPDPEPYLHDHPVTFLSLILRGWYNEKRWDDGTEDIQKNRWWNWIRATDEDRHTICEVAPKGAVTLCFMGPKTREWGFHVLDEQGHTQQWIYWKDYYKALREGRDPVSGQSQ
jgi:hypothetical protein